MSKFTNAIVVFLLFNIIGFFTFPLTWGPGIAVNPIAVELWLAVFTVSLAYANTDSKRGRTANCTYREH